MAKTHQPPRSWPRAVVFDLDGTLIDSAGDIADVLNGCLADEGLPAFDQPSVTAMIGGGARVLIERALLRLKKNDDRALLDKLHHVFEARYGELGAGRSTVFPGGRELLAQLTDEGAVLGICTNKPAAITARTLDQLDLTRWFKGVIGETPALARKPEAPMLLATLAKLGVPPNDAVMIGDSAADIGAARAAHVAAVAVTFGYTTTPAAELGADVVIDSLTEVPAALAKLAKRRPGLSQG